MPARRSLMMPLDSIRLSARVVLPWSTWAIMVTRRVDSGGGSIVAMGDVGGVLYNIMVVC